MLSQHINLKQLSRVGPTQTPFLDPRMEATNLRSNHNIFTWVKFLKFLNPELKEIQILKLAGCLQKFNDQVCLNYLKTNQGHCHNLHNSAF